MLPLPPSVSKFLGAFVVFLAMLSVSFCDGNPSAQPPPSPTATPSITPVASCPQPAGQTAPAPQSGLPSVAVTVTGNGKTATLAVDVAATGAQRTVGLMSRPRMPEGGGMLFLFPNSSSGGFWMRNTLIPLSIAYLAADGTVLAIRDGVPCDLTILSPGLAYQNVLEVNQGWFERHGLGVGSVVGLPSGLPAPQ